MKLHLVAIILLIIGGLNWLLLGLFDWEVGSLFGGLSAPISRIIYILVGLAAVLEIFIHKKTCRACGRGGSMGSPMSS